MKIHSKIALFGLALMAGTASADYEVRCESHDHRYKTCQIGKHGYVRMLRQHSRSPCIQGRTWDYTRNHIWVDDACKATFLVEGRHHTRGHSSHSGEKAVAAVAGLALLAAAAKKDRRYNDSYYDRYHDDDWYGSRHSSYIPGWMIGRFKGYSSINGRTVRLNINDEGRVRATVNGIKLQGYVNDRRLYMGDHEFRINKAHRGFKLTEVGNRRNVVYYQKK